MTNEESVSGGEPDALTIGRPISDSEIGTLLACPARWDFRYGGRLAGSTLERKAPALVLREGKAWGAAWAAYHAVVAGDDPFGRFLSMPLARARDALRAALATDAEQQAAAGVYDEDAHGELLLKLDGILTHYAATSGPRLNLVEPEHELRVPIRAGYFLHGFLDGIGRDDEGRKWGLEAKLRTRLTDYAHVCRMPQVKRYVWGYNRMHPDDPLVGIIVDERFNGAPGPVNLRKDGTPGLDQTCSLDAYLAAYDAIPLGEATLGKSGKPLKSQECSPDVYRAACLAAGTEADDAVLAALAARRQPNPETIAALEAQRWQARHRVIFTAREMAETERDLLAACDLIELMDSGAVHPIRNASPWSCRGCFARDVCDDPGDDELVDALFTRAPAKRDRPPLETIGAQS